MFLEDGLIAQTKVAGQIDGFNVGRQARNDLHCLPMRKRQENAVNVVWVFWCRNEVELSQTVQIAVNFADRFTGLFVGGYENQLDVRMEQENAQQLRAAITGAAKNPDANFVLLVHFSPPKSLATKRHKSTKEILKNKSGRGACPRCCERGRK